MLSVHGRKPAAVIVEPIARMLLRLRISPNAITIVGAALSVTVALVLIPTGHLFAAAVWLGFFTAIDMVDGTMARLRGGGTRFGATLDATCDRITDGALFAAVTWWLVYSYHAPGWLVLSSLVVLVSSQVISYVKARGEASGIEMVGGLIERPERLIIGLVGVGFQGLGIPYSIEISLTVLAVASLFTVYQRIAMAARSDVADMPSAAPAGAGVSRSTKGRSAARGSSSRTRSLR